MTHRATFLRYEPEVDGCSGQHMDGEYPEVQLCCGVRLADMDPRPVDLAEGATVSLYTLRLPHWMASKARPLSRYRIEQAHGRPLARPLTLEQVGEVGMTSLADTSQVSAALKRLVEAASGEALERALMAGGLVLEARAKGNIVRYDFIDTGATLNSTQARPSGEGSVQVGPTTEYAIYGELGVGQAPKPFMREAFDEGKGAALAAVAAELKGTMQ